ncbi:MAG: hypothetical protein Q7S22_07780 [Candidatus Micrarchaeota archaeon]|nr:hypothetical protein [Candidatus Micrarchaeota archaeon]
MVRVESIEITDPELNAFEDLIVAWILCDEHKVKSYDKSQVQIFTMQNNCKKCQIEVKKIKNKSFKLWKKLVHAYETARDGK